MKKGLRVLLAFLFPLVVCTDTNGIVYPYKVVTNTFAFTNMVTNIHTVTQIDYHFTTTNQFDGYVLLSRVPGEDWKIDAGSTSKPTNWIIGAQSQREFLILLMNRPPPVTVRRAE